MGGGSKGESQKPAFTPKYSGMLEDVLTGSALGSMLRNNPNAAGFLKPYAGQGMMGGMQGQGNKGGALASGAARRANPYRFGQ